MKSSDYDLYLIKALDLGVSDAVILSPKDIVVDPQLALMCEGEKCPGFGKGGNCPPHAMTPIKFMEIIKNSHAALVFRIVVPSELLYSSGRNEIAGYIHKTSAEIERYIVSMGHNAMGFAGGSCKEIFCSEKNGCRVINQNKTCRFPDESRNSMSGLGVNFNKLNKTLGWDKLQSGIGNSISTGMMVGIVIIE